MIIQSEKLEVSNTTEWWSNSRDGTQNIGEGKARYARETKHSCYGCRAEEYILINIQFKLRKGKKKGMDLSVPHLTPASQAEK